MLIYNVTTKVDWSIANEWVKWMLDVHMLEVTGTGCFERHQLVKLLEVDESEGPTYAAQYFASAKEKYSEYISVYAASLRQQVITKRGDKFIAFRTLMEVVN